jgi:DNA-binding NarL/FixJ family response regulator
MLPGDLPLKNGCHYTYDRHTLALRCGLPTLELPLIWKLELEGLRFDPNAPLVLLVDLPAGFAYQQLEMRAFRQARVIVVTHNPCPAYWENLWDLQPAGLLVAEQLEAGLMVALHQVVRGGRYRRVSAASSSLTVAERALLHRVACGWNNQRIARDLHVEDKTVRNTLTHVYRKIGVANRVQAALYYWGCVELCR